MSTVHRLLWNLAQDGLVDRMSKRPLASGFDLP